MKRRSHGKSKKSSSSSSSSKAVGSPQQQDVTSLSAIDQIINHLADERAENRACPDEEERKRILQAMLEFAAAEASPHLFNAIARDLGGENFDDTIFLKAYTMFEVVNGTEGDGAALEPYLDEFKATLIEYAAPAGRHNPVLEEFKYLILNELKAHICIGHLIGPRSSDDSGYDLNNDANVAAFEEAFDIYFPVDVKSHHETKNAAVAYSLVIRDELEALIQYLLKSNKRDRAAAAKYLDKVLEKHCWNKFIDALRLFISVLLYTVFDGPALLAATRSIENDIPSPAAQLLDLHRSRPPKIIRADHSRSKRSHRFNMLVRVWKAAGGAPEDWDSIVNKDEKEGEDALRAILEKAVGFRECGDYDDEDANPRLIDDEEIYGDIEVYQTDDEQPIHAPGKRLVAAVAARAQDTKEDTKKKRRASVDPDVEELEKFDPYSQTNQNGKKRRKRPVPWTEEENQCLMNGIQVYGVGQWARILNHYHDVFKKNERTSISLKDRHRNIEMRNARLQQQKEAQLGV